MDSNKQVKLTLAITWISMAIILFGAAEGAKIKLDAIQLTELKQQRIIKKAHEAKIPVEDPAESLDEVDYKEISCLAQNMYFEARNQSDEGLLAVGFVTINRTKEDKFSKTICGVIHEAEFYPRKNKKGIDVPIKGKCQFSWYCDGKKDIINDQATWDRVYNLAYHLYLYHDIMTDLTVGATYYQTKESKIKVHRDAVKTVSIQRHVFFKTEG
jgi:spore germination cell wall hydrolase CwlJ-like protein